MTTSNKLLKIRNVLYVAFSFLLSLSMSANGQQKSPTAIIDTTMGVIELQLYQDRAPVTVANFKDYANSGFYNDTLFHRVIPNFMVQGGGFDSAFSKKANEAPIKNEANAFIPNLRGTISMARTNDPHSATSQFFINVKDNASLNKSSYNAGYAVFGKVLKGMDVADKISRVSTVTKGRMGDVPAQDILIKSIIIKEAETEEKPRAPKIEPIQ